jgi:hypothetical protein
VSTVTVDLSSIFGSATTALTKGNCTLPNCTWTKTGITAPLGTTAGAKPTMVTAKDASAATVTYTPSLTVN